MAFLYLFKFGYSEGYCSTCVTVMLLLKTIELVSINSASLAATWFFSTVMPGVTA